jgi:hypothetical protein
MILLSYLVICYNLFSCYQMWISLISHYERSHTLLWGSWRCFIDSISKRCVHSVQWIMLLTLVLSCLSKLPILISWLVPPHIKYHTSLLPDNLHVDHKIVLWVEENSHVMLFYQQSLLQLRSHSYFLSHTLIGSIYMCYVDFSLVAFGNGVMTNDRWCRDETESLLWCTHGWAARHALVSRLIVMIHYKTMLMCYLLWIFSQSYRCILSQYVAIFCPNLSFVSCQILSREFAFIFSLGATCFSTLKDPHSNLGTRFYFALCREIYPNLGCSVKISISRSHLSPFIKLLMNVSPSLELFDLKNNQIWSLLKLFILEANTNSKVNLVSQLPSRLIYSNSR